METERHQREFSPSPPSHRFFSGVLAEYRQISRRKHEREHNFISAFNLIFLNLSPPEPKMRTIYGIDISETRPLILCVT